MMSSNNSSTANNRMVSKLCESSPLFFPENGSISNFMGSKSYKLNPLQKLMVVCISMICVESQYYCSKNNNDKTYQSPEHFLFREFYSDSSSNYFEKIVDDALIFHYQGCLEFVSKLRNEYCTILNSNYLLVKALQHRTRPEFNKTHPSVCKIAIEQVGCLPTDWTTQYELLKESGKPIPTIWKKTIAHKLQQMTAYHAAKYIHDSKTNCKMNKMNQNQSHLANIMDLIRITHPQPTDVLSQFVKTKKIIVDAAECTWEQLRSAKKTWLEINLQIRLPHMALLHNLRNILKEYCLRKDTENALQDILVLTEQLVDGVRGEKQLPFRYFSAYKKLIEMEDDGEKNDEISNCASPAKSMYFRNLSADQQYIFKEMNQIVIDGLNRCVLESVECIPPIKGRVDCLTDNSWSSRNGFISEYGTVNIYEISNLSAILTAYRATDGGSVWIFGDKLVEYVVTKTPILTQLEEVNRLGTLVGMGTETGVWLFWEKFIQSGAKLDTVFIYSDMQAGTGELYAFESHRESLTQMSAAIGSQNPYIDVLKLVETYRTQVYAKVNLFSVQVVGYDNLILPDILYRGALLYGWTGKEAKLAYEMNELWDSIEFWGEDNHW